CWAPGCAHTFSSLNRTFDTCAQCKRVAYCSKECQVRAWKDARVPHKVICKKMRRLTDAIGPKEKPDSRDMQAFVRACEDKKVDVELIADVERH
ncbi:hypothetical protein BOTBODRAFT_81172, partial [Botryobasidium botryosum FD-172 SS1]